MVDVSEKFSLQPMVWNATRFVGVLIAKSSLRISAKFNI
jgi:hypothetical protein